MPLLKFYHHLNLESKTNTNEFHNTLARLTDNTGVDPKTVRITRRYSLATLFQSTPGSPRAFASYDKTVPAPQIPQTRGKRPQTRGRFHDKDRGMRGLVSRVSPTEFEYALRMAAGLVGETVWNSLFFVNRITDAHLDICIGCLSQWMQTFVSDDETFQVKGEIQATVMDGPILSLKQRISLISRRLMEKSLRPLVSIIYVEFLPHMSRSGAPAPTTRQSTRSETEKV